MTGYDALAELAQRELDLVSAGALERLPELYARREALVAALPDIAPLAAGPALERAAGLQTQVTELLGSRLREAGGELRRLNTGRSAMAGYAPPDERVKLVDRAG